MPADLSPAAELRAAAARLREHAGMASGGRWHHLCMGSEGCSVINDGHLRERKHVAFCGRKEWKADHADADYIAMMAPPVALAVADWLENIAGGLDECPPGMFPSGALASPLRVARAVMAGDRP